MSVGELSVGEMSRYSYPIESILINAILSQTMLVSWFTLIKYVGYTCKKEPRRLPFPGPSGQSLYKRGAFLGPQHTSLEDCRKMTTALVLLALALVAPTLGAHLPYIIGGEDVGSATTYPWQGSLQYLAAIAVVVP